MFRTADLPNLTFARWMVWVLAACLMLHFLVEDAALLSIWEAGDQPGLPGQTGIPGSDEMTHQDDLALPVILPERMVYPTPVTTPIETVPHAQPVRLPIRIPPKVA